MKKRSQGLFHLVSGKDGVTFFGFVLGWSYFLRDEEDFRRNGFCGFVCFEGRGTLG